MLSTQKIRTTQWLHDIFFMTLSVSLFYAFLIGSYPLFTPDEGRYSEVAREMLVSGDYITPHLNGVAFLDKPILYYWLQALAIKLFGLKEWALRFWPATMGIMGSIVVYITGRIIYNRRTGILSAIILATSPLYFGASHYANLDLEVSVLISNALLFFISALNVPKKNLRFIFLMLAYSFSALATLTKGLIGIAFPIIIVSIWIVLLNRWKLLLQIRLALGLTLFIVITAPWYILVQNANSQFFDYFFVLQQFSRFLTKADFNNQTTTWFYAPIVLFGFFPWACFLLQAMYQKVKNIWQDKQRHASELFFIIWLVTIFTFFSIPKSKTIGYILPVFPPLALITGNYLSSLWEQKQNSGLKYGIILFIITSIALAIFLLSEPTHNFLSLDSELTPHLMLAGWISAVVALVVYMMLRSKKLIHIFYSILIYITIFLLCIISSATKFNHKSTKPIANIISTEIKPNDDVITYYRYYQDLPIYLQRRITVVANWHNNQIIKSDNWQRELWYHMKYIDTSAWLIEKSELYNRWAGDKRLFLLITDDLYHLFTQQLGKYSDKTYIIGSMIYNNKDLILIVSNQPNANSNKAG